VSLVFMMLHCGDILFGSSPKSDAALEEGLDLEQIYKYQDPGYFRKRGVKRGPAEHFVEDIPA